MNDDPHPQAKEIKRLRKLLPNETKDLQDENVAFMVSRLEGVSDKELATRWEAECEAHFKEWAAFLYLYFLIGAVTLSS
jgi:hypothetical protein